MLRLQGDPSKFVYTRVLLPQLTQQQRIFLTPELRRKAGKQEVNYFSQGRVNKLVNLIITAVIFILLIIPVVVLYELSNQTQHADPFEAVGILIIFTLLFGAAMSSLTTATRQELFAASAAYCAVLVVFISNVTTQTVKFAPGLDVQVPKGELSSLLNGASDAVS